MVVRRAIRPRRRPAGKAGGADAPAARRLALLIILAVLSVLPAGGAVSEEEVVLGLSRNRVAINVSFDGSEIFIFGAVKRDSPPPKEAPLQVILTVEGPKLPVLVRRKQRRYGIWINTDAILVDLAPSFYAVQTTAPFEKIITETEDLRYKISIPKAIRSAGNAGLVPDVEAFTEAVIRIRTREGAYQFNEGALELREETLFGTTVKLPANLTEGHYKVRVFLTRDRQVVSHHEAEVEVRKVGLERWLFKLSRQQPLLYGLMSLAIAIAAGWIASQAFRFLRR